MSSWRASVSRAAVPWLTECEGLSGRLMWGYNPVLYASGVAAVGGLIENRRAWRWALLTPVVVVPLLRWATPHEYAGLVTKQAGSHGGGIDGWPLVPPQPDRMPTSGHRCMRPGEALRRRWSPHFHAADGALLPVHSPKQPGPRAHTLVMNQPGPLRPEPWGTVRDICARPNKAKGAVLMSRVTAMLEAYPRISAILIARSWLPASMPASPAQHAFSSASPCEYADPGEPATSSRDDQLQQRITQDLGYHDGPCL